MDTVLVCSCHEVEFVVFLASVDQEASGGEEETGSHQ